MWIQNYHALVSCYKLDQGQGLVFELIEKINCDVLLTCISRQLTLVTLKEFCHQHSIYSPNEAAIVRPEGWNMNMMLSYAYFFMQNHFHAL